MAAKARQTEGKLSRDRILAAALRVVEEDGFDGLSIRNVARVLDAAPMSLYTHVRNKDELVVAVADALIGQVRVQVGGGKWQDSIYAFARAHRNVLRKHPDAIVHIAAAAAHPGPNALKLMERALGLLRGAGFTEDSAADAFYTVLQFNIGSALMPAAARTATDRGEARMSLAELSSTAHPHTTQMADVLTDATPDQRYERGLDLLIEGLESSLDRPALGEIRRMAQRLREDLRLTRSRSRLRGAG